MKISFAVVALVLCLCGLTTSTLPAVPAGLPSTFSIGMTNINVPTIPFSGLGYYYQYLTGDIYTPSQNWYSWQDTALPPGQFVVDFISTARANNLVPVLTYYCIVSTSPQSDSGAGSIAKLSDPNFVSAYLGNLQTFFTKAVSSSPVILHFEPDLLGYFEAATNGDPTKIAVALSASGFPGVGGFPNNLQGLIQALDYIRSATGATNVKFAIHCSVWGTNTDINKQKPDSATVASLGQTSGNWILAVDPNRYFSLVFFEFTDRDAAFYCARDNSGNPCSSATNDGSCCRSYWWDESDFARNLLYVQNVLSVVNLRGVFWQVPFGNTQMRAMNNQDFHFQDNKVEWFLGSNDNGNMDRYNQVGVIAVLYGPGMTTCTTITDSAGDGVTNPAAINGNNIENYYTTADDGGYFAWRASNYSARGYLPLAAEGTGTTPVTYPSANPPPAAPSASNSPAAPPPNTANIASLPIFTAGAFQGSWTNSWSWASSYSVSGGVSLTPGANSIAYTPQNWDGLYFVCSSSGSPNCFNSNYYGLYFQVHGGSTGGQKFTIQLAYNHANQGPTISFQATANTWSTFVFPFANFNPTSSEFFGFIIQDAGSAGVGPAYFDAMYVLGYDSQGQITYPASKKRSLSAQDNKVLAALWRVDPARLLPVTTTVASNKRQAAGAGGEIAVLGLSAAETAAIQDVGTWVPAYNAQTGASWAVSDVAVTVSTVSPAVATTAGLSTGAIVGIVIGSVVGGVLVLGLAAGVVVGGVVLVRNMLANRNEEYLDEEAVGDSEAGAGDGAEKPKKRGISIYPGRKGSRFKSITARSPSILLAPKNPSEKPTSTTSN